MTVDYINSLKEKARKIEEFKKKFFLELQDLSEEEQIEALLENEELLDQMEREYRIARSEYDILYFTYEYFSDDRNPDNDDNLIPAGSQRTLCKTGRAVLIQSN